MLVVEETNNGRLEDPEISSGTKAGYALRYDEIAESGSRRKAEARGMDKPGPGQSARSQRTITWSCGHVKGDLTPSLEPRALAQCRAPLPFAGRLDPLRSAPGCGCCSASSLRLGHGSSRAPCIPVSSGLSECTALFSELVAGSRTGPPRCPPPRILRSHVSLLASWEVRLLR